MTLTFVRRAVGIVCTAWAALFWLWPRAIDWATCDRAYYYFTIARNLANGEGSTFDRIHPTNDFHSLWLGICILPHWFGLDDALALRVVLTAQMACIAYALDITLAMFDRKGIGVLGGFVLVALVLSPWGIAIFANGTESAIAVLVAASMLDKLENRDSAFSLALLLAASYLIHPAGALLVAFVSIAGVRKGWSRLEVIDVALFPLLVIVATMSFELWQFGTPLPLRSPGGHPWIAAILIIAITIAMFVRWSPVTRAGEMLDRAAPVFGYGAAIAALEIASHPAPSPSRWAVLGFGGAVIVGAFTVDAESWRPLGIVFALGQVALVGRSVMEILAPARSADMATRREAALWIRENVEVSAVLSAIEPGVVAYYSHRRVVDGGALASALAHARGWRTITVPIDYALDRKRDARAPEPGRGLVHTWTYARAGLSGRLHDDVIVLSRYE